MRFLLILTAALLLAHPCVAAERPRLLETAPVLPLALDDDFQFRKFKLFLNDPEQHKVTPERMITFERAHVNFGAITPSEIRQRHGHYLTFIWKARRRADITVRLEYRQQNLESYVQAQEVSYEAVKGSVTTKFAVTGEDYLADGRITAWRALLIENGRVVGLKQSFLWH